MHKTFHKSDHSHPSAVQYLDSIPHLPTIDERHVAWINYQAVTRSKMSPGRTGRVFGKKESPVQKMASHDAQGSLVARTIGCRFVCALGSRAIRVSVGPGIGGMSRQRTTVTAQSHDIEFRENHAEIDGRGTGPTPLVSCLAAQDLSNDWECSPPSQVPQALRAMIGCESCPTQDDDISAPALAEDIGQCDKKVRSVGEGPDTGEPPPTGISATAQELVRKTHVNLGHLSQPQFLPNLSCRRSAFRGLANGRHQFQCAVCSSMSWPASHRRAAVPVTYKFKSVVEVDMFFLDWKGQEVPILSVMDHTPTFSGVEEGELARRWRLGRHSRQAD